MDKDNYNICKYKGTPSEVYLYGMKMRPFAPGAQPMLGIIDAEDDPTGYYYAILTYNRRLTDDEVKKYELVDMNNGDCDSCQIKEGYSKNDR